MISTASDPLDSLAQESFEQYREKAKTHLTSHALGDFRKCPLLYWKKQQGLIPDEDRPAYLVGRGAHKLILEGQDKFAAEFAVGGPVNERTGKPYGSGTQAWAKWAAEQGKAVLTDEQYALISKMADGVRGHKLASELLFEGVPEGTVRGDYCGVPAQARLDWLNLSRGIIDLKTADSLDYFAADARRYGYIHQLAFYVALFRWVAGEKLPAWLIAIEKQEPYRCGVWRVDDAAIDFARKENEAAIGRMKTYAAAKTWPTGFEEMLVIDSV